MDSLTPMSKTTEIFLLLLATYAFFIVPFIILSLLAWIFGRDKIHWYREQLLILVFPIIIWLLGQSKGFTSVLIFEPLIIGCLAALIPWLQLIFPHLRTRKAVRITLLIMGIAVILVAIFFPALPE